MIINIEIQIGSENVTNKNVPELQSSMYGMQVDIFPFSLNLLVYK